MISHLCSLKRTLYIVYGEQCRTAVFKNLCYVQCIQSSAEQLYTRIHGMYSVWRVVHDSCIQAYMLCTVYAEQCRTAVFKNLCYVQCMQSCAQQLFSRIYVMYSVWRVVHDSCIQAYMLCTVYAEQCTTSVFKNICYVQCLKSSAQHLYLRIHVMYNVFRVVQDICIQECMLCIVYGELCTTAVFKNICYVQCMQSSARHLYSRIFVMYSVWRVVHDICIQAYLFCTVYGEQCRTTVFKNTCYVQCMQSSARHLYSRICYVQCMESIAGQLY